MQPPEEWVSAALESRELLSICLKKLKGLNRVKLVDAGFVWTEPHSKRLKVFCYGILFKNMKNNKIGIGKLNVLFFR